MRFADVVIDFLWRRTCRFGVHRMFYMDVHWDLSHTRATWAVPCCKYCHCIDPAHMQEIGQHTRFMRVAPYSNPYPM